MEPASVTTAITVIAKMIPTITARIRAPSYLIPSIEPPISSSPRPDPNSVVMALMLGFAIAGGITSANLMLWTGARRKHPQLEQLADRLAAVAQAAARPDLQALETGPRSPPK